MLSQNAAKAKRFLIFLQSRDGGDGRQDDRQPLARPGHGQLRADPVPEHLPGLLGRRRCHDHRAVHRCWNGGAVDILHFYRIEKSYIFALLYKLIHSVLSLGSN